MRQHPRLFALHEVKPLKVADPSRRFSWESQVREWSCLVDLVGGGYSGRVPLLLHTGRPLLYIERTVRTFYDTPPHAIQPWKHYVPIATNLHDVPTKLQWALDHPRKAEAIAAAGVSFAREHLHVHSIACYWWQLLTAFSELQDFEPRSSGFRRVSGGLHG